MELSDKMNYSLAVGAMKRIKKGLDDIEQIYNLYSVHVPNEVLAKLETIDSICDFIINLKR